MADPGHASFDVSLAFGIGASDDFRQAMALTRRCGRAGAEFAAMLAAALAREQALWSSRLQAREALDAMNSTPCRSADTVDGDTLPPIGVIVGALCYIGLFRELLRLGADAGDSARPAAPLAGWNPASCGLAADAALCRGSAQAAARVRRAIGELRAAPLPALAQVP